MNDRAREILAAEYRLTVENSEMAKWVMSGKKLHRHGLHQCALNAISKALSEGQAIERARIVEWLRAQQGHPQACGEAQRTTAFYSGIFADSIERGDHIPESGTTDG